MGQSKNYSPTAEDLEKLAQLREVTAREAAQASPYMASLWEALHAHVARAHLRAQRALARAERSAVLQAAKAARSQPVPQNSASLAGQGEEKKEGTNGG